MRFVRAMRSSSCSTPRHTASRSSVARSIALSSVRTPSLGARANNRLLNSGCATLAQAWDREKRAEIISSAGIELFDLWELSPVRFDDATQHTEEIIDALFPGNPLLCCGESTSEFDTRPREAWRGELAAWQLIVPSPMSAPRGAHTRWQECPLIRSLVLGRASISSSNKIRDQSTSKPRYCSISRNSLRFLLALHSGGGPSRLVCVRRRRRSED